MFPGYPDLSVRRQRPTISPRTPVTVHHNLNVRCYSNGRIQDATEPILSRLSHLLVVVLFTNHKRAKDKYS